MPDYDGSLGYIVKYTQLDYWECAEKFDLFKLPEIELSRNRL